MSQAIHQFMMSTWHGKHLSITGPLWGESGGFPLQRASNTEIFSMSCRHNELKGSVMQIFDVFSTVNLNILWNKQSNCRWFDELWRLCDVMKCTVYKVLCCVDLVTSWHHGFTWFNRGCPICCWQTHDYPSASEVILNSIGKIVSYITLTNTW